MADTGVFRIPHHAWQRGNINAAAAFLRELLANDPDNARIKALHEGLLDVLDPTRVITRQQRELARVQAAMRAAERRTGERRRGTERRQKDINVPAILDRRSGIERRSGKDRRRP